MSDSNPQDKAWSRHAAHYDDVFLNPFRPNVENPLLRALDRVGDPGSKTVIDLGCGTGPLLPHLEPRFGRVLALDFAPGMIKQAKARLGRRAERVEWLNRSMSALEDLKDQIDVAVAVNSIVMPDTREIDRTLAAIHASLRPG
ncbi:MAG TPA: methyltransferase domain-containing protein, partial [Isosphaeraceae bacterium]|nr:methyltransferase domain-containing protein [Isosphaeraceae bacterium]